MKKILVPILLVLLLCFYALMAIGSGEDNSVTKETAAAGSSQAESTSADNPETKPAEEAQTTAPAGDDQLRIFPGETLNDGDFQIVFESVEDFTGYNEYFAPASGNKIIKLNLKCQNNGSSDEFISYYSFDCYADNETAEIYLYGDDSLSATISPGRGASGALYFEVPADAESIEVEYETNVWTNEKAIFVVK